MDSVCTDSHLPRIDNIYLYIFEHIHTINMVSTRNRKYY